MSEKPKIIQLDGSNLTIQNLYKFSADTQKQYQFEIHLNAEKKVQKSREFVLKIIESKKPMYGINTGFGVLADKFIDRKDLAKLQLNLIRSHAVGVGKPYSRHVTRSIMLILANSLLKGYSGIQPEIIDRIFDFLNQDIAPVVPEKGSVGASGDLAPLSHIAHCLIGEGLVVYNSEIQPVGPVLKSLKLKPVVLGPKDGLALINGTHVMCALASKAIVECENLVRVADLLCAMSLDGLRGSTKAFDEELHSLKPHAGNIKVAKNIRNLIKGSKILESHKGCHRVQDPYSFRCAPQVHGAVRQSLAHAKQVVETELQAVTDNPIIFADRNEVISGGHFHGEALAMVMDYLAIGMSELCNISERRVVKLVNPEFSELPVFLTKNPGLNSGLMIAQYTSAALVSENKVLSHPASVDSVPTNNDKEDHVSMGITSGRKLHEILFNVRHCLAIEALTASQAIHLLRPLQSSKIIEKAISCIREVVPPIESDRYFAKDVESIAELILSNDLLHSIEVDLE